METSPHLRLYVTPVQIDPVKPEMPISTPPGYSARDRPRTRALLHPGSARGHQGPGERRLQRRRVRAADRPGARGAAGPARVRAGPLRTAGRGLPLLLLQLARTRPATCCGATWTPHSPTHAEADPGHADRIRDVYAALDAALGRALDRARRPDAGDHGHERPRLRALQPRRSTSTPGCWTNGYLVLKDGVEPGDVELLAGVDWSRTRAYAIGINGLYLNLRGRERDGIVAARRRARGAAGGAGDEAGGGGRSAWTGDRPSSTPTAPTRSTTGTGATPAPTSSSATTAAGAAATSRPWARCRPRSSSTTC